jgi:beta-galactosamide-alpha-2,3-sialyltransferase
MTLALVLCRTPFQANLIERVLREECVDCFDLLYYTNQNTTEDMHYFAALSQRSDRAEFVHLSPSRFDVLNYIRLRARARPFLRDLAYDRVILASLDNFVFSAIARKQAAADLVTFDDGMANVLVEGAIYRRTRYGGRGDIYRALFGAYTPTEIRDRIARHYTIFPQFENIVSRDRVRSITWPEDQPLSDSRGPVFFIGQPFHELLTSEKIARMVSCLRGQRIDYYVRHPREVKLLDIGAQELDKEGRIAEDAILKFCGYSKPTIIGLNSTILFTIPSRNAMKHMLVFNDDEASLEAARFGRAVGCSIFEVP